MNLEIRNFRSTNNTDFGENPYEWKFEDWDHQFSDWSQLPDNVNDTE